MREAHTDLDPFFDKIRNIPRKNSGGCLFFGYVFWLWLKAHGLPTESFEIVQYDYDGQASRHNMKWIEGQKEQVVSSAHFTWMYEGIEYDADGEYVRRRHDVTPLVLSGLNTQHGSLVEKFCKNALRDRDQWNETFDRDSAVRKCRSRFDMKIPLR